MQEFAERDKETPPKEGAVLFVGSSSIRLWELDQSWPGLDKINNGFGGSTLADSIHHFDALIAPYSSSAIIIYAGDNDVAGGLTAEETAADFEKLAGKIRETHPDVPVIYIAIKPSIKRWELWPTMKSANDLIAAFCANHKGFHFADIAKPMLETPDAPPSESFFKKDGLHLNDSGYEAWKAVIDPLLKEATDS